MTLHSRAIDTEAESLIRQAVQKMSESLKETGQYPLLDLTRDDCTLLYKLAHSLYQAGSFEKCEVIFRRLIITSPLQLEYWHALAGTLQAMKKHEEALIPWSMCCLMDESNADYHMRAAECLFALDNPGEAKKALIAAQRRATDAQIEQINCMLEGFDG
ncbi:MAG: hypothetical protein S4CHLAM102_03580 [Chlamydiia bacterium]|nr:hypothetical protein [Chlamydiia bacterium]